MKNRYGGCLIITFIEDGYKERCVLRAKKSKGEAFFLKQVYDSITTILQQHPNEDADVSVTYSGDFEAVVHNFFKEVPKSHMVYSKNR